MSSTNKIEEALMAAAKAAAIPEAREYAEKLESLILESGLYDIVISAEKTKIPKWAYPLDGSSGGIRLTFNKGEDSVYHTVYQTRNYGFVWDGWMSPVVTAYYNKRVQYHYQIAQDKLLAAANILVEKK